MLWAIYLRLSANVPPPPPPRLESWNWDQSIILLFQVMVTLEVGDVTLLQGSSSPPGSADFL